jgi:copper chaperone NosL
MKRYLAVLLAVVLLLTAACGGASVEPGTPPTIVYGEDVCDHCGMIINDERFAAGAVVQMDGDRYEHRRFDDIGDMFAFAQELEENSAERVVTLFVHDYESLEWIEADQAHFVKAASLRTPMGSGLVAFGNGEVAKEQAAVWQGEVLNFDEARQQGQMDHSHAQH